MHNSVSKLFICEWGGGAWRTRSLRPPARPPQHYTNTLRYRAVARLVGGRFKTRSLAKGLGTCKLSVQVAYRTIIIDTHANAMSVLAKGTGIDRHVAQDRLRT
jgi:hypothetical protein